MFPYWQNYTVSIDKSIAIPEEMRPNIQNNPANQKWPQHRRDMVRPYDISSWGIAGKSVSGDQVTIEAQTWWLDITGGLESINISHPDKEGSYTICNLSNQNLLNQTHKWNPSFPLLYHDENNPPLEMRMVQWIDYCHNNPPPECQYSLWPYKKL